MTTADTPAPRRGVGHYSDDGQRWWDDRSKTWYPVAAPDETLEIELEDAGATSWLRSLITTLTSQSGTAQYRFVAVAHGPNSQSASYRIPGETFPVTRAFLADLPPQEPWAPGMTSSLQRLQAELIAHGWISIGRGTRPWSYRFRRPCIEASASAPGVTR